MGQVIPNPDKTIIESSPPHPMYLFAVDFSFISFVDSKCDKLEF